MQDATRKWLDRLDAFFASKRSDPVAVSELWDVLTALRGPDSNDTTLKNGTTVPIRRAAFPKLAALHEKHKFPTHALLVPMGGCGARTFNSTDSLHFKRHAQGAARALGIGL